MIKSSALILKFEQAKKEKFGYIWGTAGETWTQAKQDALVAAFVKKYGENWKNSEAAKKANKYYGAKNGSKWIGHKVADCSGLFSWAFAQLGGYIYHGSNTIWDKYCTSKGELTKKGRTDGKILKPGTAVFTGDSNNKGHIGLYIGNDYVIEASGTNAGVITTTISGGKWKYWGELKNVDYGAEISDEVIAIEPTRPMIKKGNKGKWVKELQTQLQKKGYDLGKWGVDGDFGSATESAVKAFQADYGLTADGIVGEKTWEKIYDSKAEKIKYVTVCIPNRTEKEAQELLKKYEGSWISNA